MRILIAEDEPTNRLLLEVSVRKWGHEPVVATDGCEAWELLQSPDAPAIALLDWMMPGIDGVEICRRLRAGREPRMVYVIMVTTHTQPGDIVAGLEAGADDYVTKPFDPHELRVHVHCLRGVDPRAVGLCGHGNGTAALDPCPPPVREKAPRRPAGKLYAHPSRFDEVRACVDFDQRARWSRE